MENEFPNWCQVQDQARTSRHVSQAGKSTNATSQGLRALWEDGEDRVAAGQVEKYLSRESLGTMLCWCHAITHLACIQLTAESLIKNGSKFEERNEMKVKRKMC